MKNINSYILEKLNINNIKNVDVSINDYPDFTENILVNKTLFLLGFDDNDDGDGYIKPENFEIDFVKKWIDENNINDVVCVITDNIFKNVCFNNQRKKYYIIDKNLYEKIDNIYLHLDINNSKKYRLFIKLSCSQNIICIEMFNNSSIYVVDKKYFDKNFNETT